MIGFVGFTICAFLCAFNVGMYVWLRNPVSLVGAVFCGMLAFFDLTLVVSV